MVIANMKLVKVCGDDKKRIKRIVDIEEEAFGKNGGVNEWILTPLARYGVVYTLEIDNEVVSIGEFMQRYQDKEIFLYGLCTEVNSRGRGYARSLLSLCEQEFRKIGLERISLTVAPDNEIALKLYERLGYKNIELLKDEYGKGVDRLLLMKEIR